MKTTLLFMLLLLVPVTVFGDFLSEAQRKKMLNVNEAALAVQGFDPVSYFQNKATQGKEFISFVHNGITYYFSSKKNLQTFKQSPEKYEPAYGGWCAWAMLEGQKVEINPKRFKIIGGKLYLFYDRFFTNTLKKWNKLTEEKTEPALIEKADIHWRDLSTAPLHE